MVLHNAMAYTVSSSPVFYIQTLYTPYSSTVVYIRQLYSKLYYTVVFHSSRLYYNTRCSGV